MIRNYRFYLSCHTMLHQHVINFFSRIEFETSNFDDDFFDTDFLDIVNRHPKILRQRSIDIYEIFRRLPQVMRTQICDQIRNSNDIQDICNGNYLPIRLNNKVSGLRQKLREYFIDLYEQVLDGEGFRDKYSTSLREHFNGFSNANEEVTLCPICGIGELKKSQDEFRDQYDHFLPKALYPFSAVNFENLVPSCTECNSFNAKGKKDIINISTGVFFYPFDDSHTGIKIEFHIAADNIEIENVQWRINYLNPDGKNDQITSWRRIYNIDNRYQGFIKGRIKKWFRHYWEYVNDSALAHLSENDRRICCLKSLEKDESLELGFIRKPALEGFLNESALARAQMEARLYA